MREALTNPALLGKELAGDSWRPWRTLLIAIMGEELTDDERVVFHSLTGRDREPGRPCREFWGIMGRRSGKSRAISVLLTYIAFYCDHGDTLEAGEHGVALCLARTRDQASIVLNYVRGIISNDPKLKRHVVGETADTIEIKRRGVDLAISVWASSARTVRGPTFVIAVADELAHWQTDETAANPDTEILRAVRPGLLTTAGMLVCISSPYARKGELFLAYRRHYGPDGDPLTLVAKAPTLAMNATVSSREIAVEYERDPEYASAEFGAEFRSDIQAFVVEDALEIATGVHSLPPVSGVLYAAFCDPSGGRSDSMTLAIAHRRGGDFILDAVHEIKAPFNPDEAVHEFAELLRAYRVSSVTGDAYGGEWPAERFRAHGIDYLISDKKKSDIYREALPMLISRRAILLDQRKLITQLCQLERRTTRGGRDSVDHPQGGHDDIANSACGVLWQLAQNLGPTLLDPARIEAETPQSSQTAIAYVWLHQGEVAIVYVSSARWLKEMHILAFAVVPYRDGLFAEIAAKTIGFANGLHSRDGAWLLVPAELKARAIQGAAGACSPSAVVYAQEISDKFDPDDPGLQTLAATHGDDIRLGAEAYEQAKSHPLGAALSFRAGDKADTALRIALLAAIYSTFEGRPT
jgi:hypothetical protein